MTIKQFIEKAITGGWEPKIKEDDAVKGWVYFYDTDYPEEGYYAAMDMKYALLDPKAWEALGRIEGWPMMHLDHKEEGGECWCKPEIKHDIGDAADIIVHKDHTPAGHAHEMIDALFKGKSVEQFRDDMYAGYIAHVAKHGEKNTSIDRINASGHYCRDNCRWATWRVQAKNRINHKTAHTI